MTPAWPAPAAVPISYLTSSLCCKCFLPDLPCRAATIDFYLTYLPLPSAARFLADFRGTVVAVTHDRYFLDNVAGWILELDRGAGIPFEGNYSGG